jgi:hypothetical protein
VHLDRARPLAAGIAAAAMLAMAPSRVSAAEELPRPPRNGAHLSFFSLFGPGVALEYERALPPRFSFLSGLGVRATGGDEYSTVALTTSLELRYWLYGKAPWTEYRGPAMVGPFLTLREDVSWTSVEDELRDRLAGTAVEVAETLGFGYRVTLGPVAVTQAHGFSLITQMDPRGRLAPTTYFALKLGVTLGVLF